MTEFAKIKIGFTIALLAVLFALKPLIDAYGGVGFLLFDYKITIQLAYFAAVAFLCIAVYLISIQFVSHKYVSILEKISNIAYACSLSAPIVFFGLWFLVVIGEVFAELVTINSETTRSVLAAILASVLTAILAATINKAIEKKDFESKQEDNRKQELELLSRAEHLIDDSHYDLSVLESCKIMELSLRQAVTLASGQSKMFSMHDLIKRARKLNLVSESDMEYINNTRILRNNATHLDSEVTKEQASQAVSVAKRLVKTLLFARNNTSYNWLKVYRSEAIKALQGRDQSLHNTVIRHLWDAWVNRDGAVSWEISEFFEAALQNNPQLIIDMFLKNKGQLESWLDRLGSQMFTDYIGGQLSKLNELKNSILSSLQAYIDSQNKKN
jgi:HEPN domain-containing protein